MRRSQVVGKVWLSHAHPGIGGYKILILCETSLDGKESFFLGVDTVDAGFGDEVLSVSGSAARQSHQTEKSPADTTIVAIVDPGQ